MDAIYISILCFAGLSCAIAGALFFVRDVLVGGGRGDVLVGRLPLARHEKPADGVLDRMDASFRRMVLDSGLGISPIAAALVMAACGIAAGGLVWLASNDVFAAAAAFCVGALLPVPYIAHRRRQRMKQINEQLPAVLDLLARAVRAGESLDQAIDLVGRKAGEPLAVEFRRCANQLKMGLAMHAAMRALAHRVRTLEMRILATTLSVHRSAGGNLADTLERMSLVIRERLSYRRQLRATTAAGRFSAGLVSLAGVFLFAYMFVFQSDYIGKLFSSPFGQSMLLTALVLEIIGLIWISRMLRSDM